MPLTRLLHVAAAHVAGAAGDTPGFCGSDAGGNVSGIADIKVPAGSYPLCDQNFSQSPCVGVVGGAHVSQQCGSAAAENGCVDYLYGASSDIMDRLRKSGTGLDYVNVCGTTPATLGSVAADGHCLPCVGAACVSADLVATMPLLLNDEVFNAAPTTTDTKDWASFPLQTLHKIWGDGGNKNNNGVSGRNVYMGKDKEKVRCADGPLDAFFGTASARTLQLEAHGDKYAGDVKGLRRGAKVPFPDSADGSSMPKCTAYADTPTGARVGGVAVTRQSYGPGTYNVLAYVPPTTDTGPPNKGRGYVFAIWPFHYEEMYATTKPSQKRGGLAGPQNDPAFPCYGNCDWGSVPTCTCPGSADQSCQWTGDEDHDIFDSITHEIDIEIPSNANGTPDGKASSGAPMDWDDKLTWATMNVNTWDNDINNYDMGTGAYYQQLGVKQADADKTFVSTDGRWHWYTIDWHVEADYTKNYVKVYFDSPFDPTGKATHNGKALPTAPTAAPVATTSRFVPTRAGRLNIGPWFGWWGYDKAAGPQFDVAVVKVAHVSIVPGTGANAGVLFPQTYDQKYKAKDGTTTTIACDFADMYSKGAPPPPPPPPPGPGPGPSPSPSPSPCPACPKPDVAHNVVSIVMIAVAAVLFLALVGVSIRLGLDERKLRKAS
jgi:hypothetical protein